MQMFDIQLEQKSSPTEIFSPSVKVSTETKDKVSARVGTYLFNAQVLTQHKEHHLAINLLRQASSLDSKNPLVLRSLADCLEALNKFDEAIFARKALVKYDYNYRSVFEYATLCYKMGQDQKALETYYEALSLISDEDPSLFELHKNIGNILIRQGDFDGAEENYNKAYGRFSNSDVLLVNLGTLEVQRQDYDRSLECFRKAVEINAENDKAWVGLALVHNQFGDHDLAWANLENALDINPKNRTAVHIMSNWAVRDCRVTRAIEALQNYLAGNEADEEMSLLLINLFCQQGQIHCAQLEVEKLYCWNPSNLEVQKVRQQLQGIQYKS